MSTVEILDLRCPLGPKQLLLKLRTDGEQAHVNSNNLLEIACRDCAKNARKVEPEVKRVLHRFNFAGELIESVVEK